MSDDVSKSGEVSERRFAAAIGLISFLTLINLFGPQATVQAMSEAFSVGVSTMGFAINASTIGMAVAGLGVALLGRTIDQRRWIWLSLVLLAVPTVALAYATSLGWFVVLRIVQGVLMAVAFTLTMAVLAESCTVRRAAAAMAAYITGNVLSNLAGRVVSATVAEYLGLSAVFLVLAGSSVVGALLSYRYIGASAVETAPTETTPPTAAAPTSIAAVPASGEVAGGAARQCAAWFEHLRNPALLATFAIGFVILFVFVGAFTYINDVLARPPFALDLASIGLVHLVFLPSVFTTPVAGLAAERMGAVRAYLVGVAFSVIGLLAMLASSLPIVLVGLTLLAMGLFFAQAAITGVVGRLATADRTAASGLYLASYYTGGLVGAVVVGMLYESFGWAVSVLALTALLATSGLLTLGLRCSALEPRPG